MSSPMTPYLNTWLTHVRSLAHKIGPRGPTTEGERRGAQYCLQSLQAIGLQPRMESFKSARSIFLPHLLVAIAMLVAFLVYPLAGRTSAVLAFLISLVALVSDLLELSFRQNPLRWILPKGDSQNVIAICPPSGEYRQDVILIAHVDSQRTPLVFKSATWLKIYKAFTTIAFIVFTLQVLLYALGVFTQRTWIWPASSVGALGAVLLAAMCIQADLTPFTHGANDNATGAGLVLTLAQHLLAEPLQHTRAWLVCTGCEEVQHYGAIDFFRRHRSEFKNPVAVVFEMLGCAGPAWLEREGIIIPFHADPSLVSLAKTLAAQRPELEAHPAVITGGNTEMADALRVGVPAITLTGFGSKGETPYWHMREDVFDNLVPGAMGRNYDFVWSYLRLLDSH